MRWLTLISVFATVLVGRAAEPSFETDVQPILKTYCFKCHGPKKTKGGVNFTKFTSEDSARRNPQPWLKVMNQLSERVMPPESAEQPTVEQRDRVVRWAEQLLDSLDQ